MLTQSAVCICQGYQFEENGSRKYMWQNTWISFYYHYCFFLFLFFVFFFFFYLWYAVVNHWHVLASLSPTELLVTVVTMVEVLGGLVKRVVLLEGLNGRDKVYTIKPIYNNLHVVKVDRWQGKEKGRKKITILVRNHQLK